MPNPPARLQLTLPRRPVSVAMANPAAVAGKPRAEGAAGPKRLDEPSPAPPPPPRENLEALLAGIEVAIAELHEKQRTSLDELQGVAVELAAATASHLCGIAVEQDLFDVERLVSLAVQQLGVSAEPVIKLHPQDLELLHSQIDHHEEGSVWSHVSLLPDPSLPRGSCRAETPTRSLISTLHERMEDIRRTWIEEMDDAQIERRKTQESSAGPKRFPDRRDTA